MFDRLLLPKSGKLSARLSLKASVSGTNMILAGDGSYGLVSSGPFRFSPGTTVDALMPHAARTRARVRAARA